MLYVRIRAFRVELMIGPTDEIGVSAPANPVGRGHLRDTQSAAVINIENLVRLRDRQELGQWATQVVMGFGLVVVMLWFGGRAAVALAIVHVVLSILMLRGHCWAALGLFGFTLSMIMAGIAVLAHDAFFYERSEPSPELAFFVQQYNDGVTRIFYVVAAIGLVTGLFVVRGMHATIVRSRYLPPQPLDIIRLFKSWIWSIGRFWLHWQAWALLLLAIVAIALVFSNQILLIIDLVVFDRPHLSMKFDKPLLAVLVGNSPWLSMILFVTYLLSLVGVSIAAWNYLRRYLAENVVQAQRRDERPPVLLLRSFAHEAITVWPSEGLFLSSTANTLEHTLEKALRAVGPVIAIGRPGESLPPLGAAREYLTGEAWIDRVGELIGMAQLIVVVMGASEGLVFEYDLLAAHGAIDKLLLVIPPDDPDKLSPCWMQFAEHALKTKGCPAPDLRTTIIGYFTMDESPVYVMHPKRQAMADHYALGLQMALHRRFNPD